MIYSKRNLLHEVFRGIDISRSLAEDREMLIIFIYYIPISLHTSCLFGKVLIKCNQSMEKDICAKHKHKAQ